MTPEQWILEGEVGVSSKTIWAVMMGVKTDPYLSDWTYDVPHDPDDLKRCLRLLELFPEWRERLPEVARAFPKWGPMIEHWDKLEAMFRAEYGPPEDPRWDGKSRDLYEFMRNLEREGRLIIGWVETSPGCWRKEGFGRCVTLGSRRTEDNP